MLFTSHISSTVLENTKHENALMPINLPVSYLERSTVYLCNSTPKTNCCKCYSNNNWCGKIIKILSTAFQVITKFDAINVHASLCDL